MKKIADRRRRTRVGEDERNIDEFNELFKEVKWIKKALNRELEQVQQKGVHARNLVFPRRGKQTSLERLIKEIYCIV